MGTGLAATVDHTTSSRLGADSGVRRDWTADAPAGEADSGAGQLLCRAAGILAALGLLLGLAALLAMEYALIWYVVIVPWLDTLP